MPYLTAFSRACLEPASCYGLFLVDCLAMAVIRFRLQRAAAAAPGLRQVTYRLVSTCGETLKRSPIVHHASGDLSFSLNLRRNPKALKVWSPT